MPFAERLFLTERRERKRNEQDLTGHFAWDVFHSLAWAVRPIPPLNLRKGTARLCLTTSLRYLMALLYCIPLIADATSQVLLK